MQCLGMVRDGFYLLDMPLQALEMRQGFQLSNGGVDKSQRRAADYMLQRTSEAASSCLLQMVEQISAVDFDLKKIQCHCGES